MIKSFRFIFWSAIILVSNLIFSCQNEDCVSIYNNHLLVGFFEADTLENGMVVVEKKDTVFYAAIADGNDSIFYSVDTVVSVLTLPVNPVANRTTFELYMIDSISYDTLSTNPLEIESTYYPNPIPHVIDVSYRRFTRVISETCAVEIGYTDLKIEEITFPVFNISEDRLSRLKVGEGKKDKINIEIFF